MCLPRWGAWWEAHRLWVPFGASPLSPDSCVLPLCPRGFWKKVLLANMAHLQKSFSEPCFNPLKTSCLYSRVCTCVLSHFSRVWLFATLWTVAHQASLTMGFSRQEYWSGLPCPPPGDLPNPGIEPMSLKSPTLAEGFFTTSAPGEALHTCGLSLSDLIIIRTPRVSYLESTCPGRCLMVLSMFIHSSYSQVVQW